MKTIIKQNSKTNNSIFDLMANSKHSSWNNRRRYSNMSQFRFI